MQTELCYREKFTKRITAYPVGYSEEELEELLKRHPEWYLSKVTIGDIDENRKENDI